MKKLAQSGVSMLPMSASAPSATPMISPMAPRIWARPIVATVSTSRDERAKRRIDEDVDRRAGADADADAERRQRPSSSNPSR